MNDFTGALDAAADIPGLAPRPESELEWWFVQGRLERAGGGRLFVMAALFLVRGPAHADPPGAMLLLHYLDAGTGGSWGESRMTPEVIPIQDEIARGVARHRFPRWLRRLALWRHRKDMEAMLATPGLIVDPGRPVFGAAPFSVSWNGFALRREAGGLMLQMPALGEVAAGEVRLTPDGGWLAEGSEALHAGFGDAFHYLSCPRMVAAGQCGGVPAEGRFWMDRQWGNYDGWVFRREPRGLSVLGWDWFGLSLDDGRSLMLQRHRVLGETRPYATFATLFGDGPPVHLDRDFAAEPVRVWQSPATGARYPVAWRVHVPQIGLEAVLEPVADDQEIPVLGSTAIWEGASEIRAGGVHRGWARVELVGYGSVVSVTEHLRRWLRRRRT